MRNLRSLLGKGQNPETKETKREKAIEVASKNKTGYSIDPENLTSEKHDLNHESKGVIFPI